MTHEDYERESIFRALQRHDEVIESLEQALRVAHESRREFINRHDLNKKCEHVYKYDGHGCRCELCGHTDEDQHCHMCD